MLKRQVMSGGALPHAEADVDPVPRADAGDPDRLLSKAEVLLMTGVTYPTIWAMVRARKFPAGRYIGARVFWLKSEVDAFIDGLPRQGEVAFPGVSNAAEKNRTRRGSARADSTIVA